MKAEASALALKILVADSEIEQVLQCGSMAKCKMKICVFEMYLYCNGLAPKKESSPIWETKIRGRLQTTIDCYAIGNEARFWVVHHEPRNQIVRRRGK